MSSLPQVREQWIPESLRALLEHLIDYAGLFPPAGLDMNTVVHNFALYAAGEHAWILGRFVVATSRLEEFERALATVAVNEQWRLTALLGSDPAADLERAAEFNLRNAGRARVDSVEAKASSEDEIKIVDALLPAETDVYFEIAPEQAAELMPIIQDLGGRAKIRTGGVTTEAIPDAEAVASFIAQCARFGVPFKATAGLHHPLRCLKPLTYAADAQRSIMHGFLNVFLTAALEYAGRGVGPALLASGRAEFDFRDEAVSLSFGDETARLLTGELLRARRDFAISFGSCSFEEPISDLQELHILSITI